MVALKSCSTCARGAAVSSGSGTALSLYGTAEQLNAYLAAGKVKASGKLRLADLAELNPEYDIDNRTAKVAARLIHLLSL